ncbi:hypothetical protein ACFVFQ_38510 [Streptomyces sp. NPDC057743]|uniref:hypothetical protein n=1 Tax=Streptomyces sp. NPDC057743 TaxID=3346236 RepID=UPI00369ED459
MLASANPTMAGTAAGAQAGSRRGGPAVMQLAPRCRVGAYLTDLYDVHPESNEFSARVWIWSLCPTKEADPLPTVTFPNGYNPSKTDADQRKVDNEWYDLMGFDGRFRHTFDRSNFPFDRHDLNIVVASGKNVASFRMAPDPEAHQTTYSNKISLPRWKIEGFSLSTRTTNYNTDFGERSDPTGLSADFSDAVLVTRVASSAPSVFWELTGPIFIIFLITMLTFVMSGTDKAAFTGRVTALGASLFAVLVNLSKLSSLIPSTSGFSMLGKLHLLTLLFVLFALAITVVSWRWADKDKEDARIRKLNRFGILVGMVFYLGGTTWLVAAAANAPVS